MHRTQPVSPGELLEREFLEPHGMTSDQLAAALDMKPEQIEAIIAGKQAITAELDERLCRYFNLSEGYWCRAQGQHDAELVD